MTAKELNKLMQDIEEAAGLNGYTYFCFRSGEVPPLPYAVFYHPQTETESADNKTWARIQTTNIELYTEQKDFDIEQKLEGVLTAHEITWEKSESYLSSEKMFEVLYEFQNTEE